MPAHAVGGENVSAPARSYIGLINLTSVGVALAAVVAEGGLGNDAAIIRRAALAKGVSEDLYDKVVNPLALTRPGTADVAAEKGA